MQQKSGVRLAFRIISWLIKAQRVLTVRELQLAVSVEEENIIFDEDSLPDRKTLLDVCASLVSIDETSDCVRFVHYTAQEFLTRNQLVPDDADLQMAIACTTFLSYDIFAKPWANKAALSRSYPLLRYAAKELRYHLKQCDEPLTEAVISRFIPRKRNIALCLYIISRSDDDTDWESLIRGFTELEFAAFLGHSSVVMRLLRQKKDTNSHYPKLNLNQSCCFGISRSYGDFRSAAHRGSQAIVKLLLENGADPNSHRDGRTLLYMAADDEAIAKLLLENGADPNFHHADRKTILCKAVGKGNEAVVKLLLENGADVNVHSPHGLNGDTALSKAVREDEEAIVKLLLENGAGANTQDANGDTVLYVAMDNGNEAIVKLLLGSGADPNAENKSGSTILHLAIGKSNEAMVKLLLEYGADARAQGRSRMSPLNCAELNGHKEIIELLRSSIKN